MKMIAVIDIGSNTFQLLIAEINNKDFVNRYFAEVAVKLGKNGFKDGVLAADAIDRAIITLNSFKKEIERFEISTIYTIATSAVRDASNGEYFVSKVKNEVGLDIQVIDGDREADLIFKGVYNAVNPKGKYLIVDIGGGSTEIILGEDEKVLWKKSHKVGIRRLDDDFDLNDPLSPDNIHQLEDHYSFILEEFYKVVKDLSPITLIGSSGAFETFRDIMVYADYRNQNYIKSILLDINEFEKLNETLLKFSTEQRMNIKGLNPMRVDTIPLASLFVKGIIEKCNINKFIQTDYALKEGVIYEYLQAE